jgi:hypothetical protein
VAKGRFVSKEICLDKKVSGLSDGYSMAGFTWLITHTDCEGRIYGDPAIVKSLIFPRRMDVTVEMVAGYIQEWEAAGLITTYEVNDDKYIEFPNFGKHQVGLRKDREPPSHIPAKCGNHPAKIRKNRVNVKLIEVNSNSKLMEVEVNADNNNPLITTFTQHTKLSPGTEAPQIAIELQKAGVIQADIVNAVNFLNTKPEMKCVSFRSIRNPAIIEMQRRTAKDKKDAKEDMYKPIYSHVEIDPEKQKEFNQKFGSH